MMWWLDDWVSVHPRVYWVAGQLCLCDFVCLCSLVLAPEKNVFCSYSGQLEKQAMSALHHWTDIRLAECLRLKRFWVFIVFVPVYFFFVLLLLKMTKYQKVSLYFTVWKHDTEMVTLCCYWHFIISFGKSKGSRTHKYSQWFQLSYITGLAKHQDRPRHKTSLGLNAGCGVFSDRYTM